MTCFCSYLIQATLNDSFLADLDELSDNEDDLLVSISEFHSIRWCSYLLSTRFFFRILHLALHISFATLCSFLGFGPSLILLLFQEEDNDNAEHMEEDIDGDLADIEALNYDDLDSVSKLQRTHRYIDIMQVGSV